MNEHLSVQGKQDSREGSIFLVLKQKLNPFLGAFEAQKIIKNQWEMRKSRPPKVEGVKNSNNKTSEPYKTWFPNTEKIPCLSFCCY